MIQERPFDPHIGIMKHEEGIDFLPSNIELSGVEISLFNAMSREYVLKSYVDSVRKDYDYILIDGMPSLGMMAINTLVAADTDQLCEMLGGAAIKSVYRLLHEGKIKAFRIGKGYKIPKVSVIEYLVALEKSAS